MKKFKIEYASGYVNCDICFKHEGMKIAKLEYYTQDYASNKRPGKICKTPQKHPHSIWICEKCLKELRREWWGTTDDRLNEWR